MTTTQGPEQIPDDDVLPELYPQGVYEVRLLMEFPDCADPSDAVEHFIEDINTYGLRGYKYRVLHENGEVWIVQDGGILPEADVLAGRVPDGTQ